MYFVYSEPHFSAVDDEIRSLAGETRTLVGFDGRDFRPDFLTSLANTTVFPTGSLLIKNFGISS